MGKINRFANIYDKDGKLLRHVNEDGYLEDYTIKELEDLVDKLYQDKDENGDVKNPKALTYAFTTLQQQYQKLGNPHESEFLEKLKAFNAAHKGTSTEEVNEKLEEVKEELSTEDLVERKTEYNPDAYIDFEEIKDVGNTFHSSI